MGVFHTVTMLLAIIGIWFGETVLEDIAIESSVVEEASVGRLPNGEHCNRCEVPQAVLWSFHEAGAEGFISWISENNEQKSNLEGLESRF